uniref:Type III potassium channel toxin protein n=1 Tax=Anemonia sulcata TaxID=6108 RepID=A0A0S1M1A6_ANESU|nr:type III potassium channel toxin protein [Anemonia sulcata]
MNKVLFLFLVVLVCATIVFASEHPAEEGSPKFRKRAMSCRCNHRGSRVNGDLWLFRDSCPTNQGYTGVCSASFISKCCTPRV